MGSFTPFFVSRRRDVKTSLLWRGSVERASKTLPRSIMLWAILTCLSSTRSSPFLSATSAATEKSAPKSRARRFGRLGRILASGAFSCASACHRPLPCWASSVTSGHIAPPSLKKVLPTAAEPPATTTATRTAHRDRRNRLAMRTCLPTASVTPGPSPRW